LIARGDGVLRAILVGEGGTAPVGEVIALIGAADEDISELQAASLAASEGNGAGEGKGGGAHPDAEPASRTDAGAGEAPASGSDSTIDGRIKASPLARRLATESGVELSDVSGSGPAGRIVKRDIEAAIAAAPISAAPIPAGPVAAPVLVPSGAEFEDIPLSQMRKTIARRLAESIGPVPHFFLTIEVDMGRAMEARRTINAMLEGEGRKISLNDLIIRATAAALKRHPACNAHWLGDSIRLFNRVHIGVAVAVEDGLITPIVRDADLKGVAHIGAEVRELAGRAREKKLQPDEYTGATFSISNLGMFGIQEFTAVINPPEAGILAVGGVEEIPVVEGGQVVVRSRMKITMSCDHRVIDGALGATFLATLKGMLEEPAAILVWTGRNSPNA
jgi:pyruvate dehydrogenase E2 component (dihydrolipoamide acetyltransferase)